MYVPLFSPSETVITVVPDSFAVIFPVVWLIVATFVFAEDHVIVFPSPAPAGLNNACSVLICEIGKVVHLGLLIVKV